MTDFCCYSCYFCGRCCSIGEGGEKLHKGAFGGRTGKLICSHVCSTTCVTGLLQVICYNSQFSTLGQWNTSLFLPSLYPMRYGGNQQGSWKACSRKELTCISGRLCEPNGWALCTPISIYTSPSLGFWVLLFLLVLDIYSSRLPDQHHFSDSRTGWFKKLFCLKGFA